ncbi:cyclic pyranopterin phosphate synthase [Kibdelosporangium banguiense]|uniref:Cyclic pyranopterin monophosphate synthase n=1 Tax=Kibdelosporangium banguiense TaxID=1365924 RepID=A0ABS4T6M3_9PSEU|nr:cyclic pyranopterin monophosphate synthase MoaC [Kibdelosporangium banguiense]MBP2320072.1 cyclic pyranopterin phosphate synthase [Kibdelosporangium banguiense]
MSLTHLDSAGRARMVDVGGKPVTARRAVASGAVVMKPETLALITSGGIAKGDVLAAARIAGIMAAKKTGELIPLCHPLGLDSVEVNLDPTGPGTLTITATASVTGKTGVEMEALTAVSVAALTVYDMCKAADKEMTIGDIRLEAKSGGRSGDYRRAAD